MNDTAQERINPVLLARAGAVAGGSVLLILLFALWSLVATAGSHPAAELSVTGSLQKVRAAEIRAATAALLQQNLSELDLEALRQAVETLPWVARARVEKSWPAGLHIRVWERQPAARWGDKSLLDVDAEVFTPEATEEIPGLPRLMAPQGLERNVLERYAEAQPRLAESAYALHELALDERGEWRARTASGVELRFGREPPLNRVPLILGAMAQALSGVWATVRYVDLRYSNGFSVGWMPAAPEETTAPGTAGGEGNG